MPEAIDLCNYISLHDDVDEDERAKLLSCCKRAVTWLSKNLRSDADPDSEEAFLAAAAVAKFNFFCDNLGQAKSFKAGDITVNRDISAEYQAQTVILENTLAQFHDILEDGGFYFETT